jgi:hypothetical protein
MQKILLLTLLLAPNYTRHRSSTCRVAVHLRVEAEIDVYATRSTALVPTIQDCIHFHGRPH